MKHRAKTLCGVTIVLVLAACCDAAVAQGALRPPRVPPTHAEVVALMREVAHRDGSTEALLAAGRYALETDPEGALEDLRAAAAARRSRSPVSHWSTTRYIATALVEAGAEDEARAIVERDLLATLDGSAEAAQSVRETTQAEYLAEMAEFLWPGNTPLVRRVADELSAALEATGRPEGVSAARHAKIQAQWLRVLALLEPERAWKLAVDGAPENWQAPGPLLRNIGRGGPSNPAEILDEVARRGVEPAGSVGAREGISLLAAALMRSAPEQAVARMAARRWDDIRVPPFDPQPIAAAAVEVGIDRLPAQAGYDALYAGFTDAVAGIDPDAALALKDRISAPDQRARALAAVVSAIADADTFQAWELALEIVQMWEPTPEAYSQALVRAGDSLAKHGGDIMGVIIGRILGHRAAAPIWWRWRQSHPEQAEEWVARRAEDERSRLLAHALARATRDGEVATALEFADRALASATPAPDVVTLVMKALAPLAPPRAREAWKRREGPPLSGWDLNQYLDALTDLAYTFELRWRGSAGPEIAEIERLVADADMDDRRMTLVRGRLALLYALADPSRVESTATPLLGLLDLDRRERVRGTNVTPAAAHAVAALMAVDREAAQAALEAHEAIMAEDDFQRELIAELALLDPEAAVALLPVHLGSGRIDFAIVRAESVRRRAHPEMMRRLAEQMLADDGRAALREALTPAVRISPEALEEAYRADGFRGLLNTLQVAAAETERMRRNAERQHGGAIAGIVEYLLYSKREDLVPVARGFVDCITRPTEAEALLTRLPDKSLSSLPDTAIERLLVRLFNYGVSDLDPRAVRALTAELASRDWKRGMDVLSELPPLQQINALAAVRTVPAAEAEGDATGPAAGPRYRR
ncbi:MAG: hypothetical protein GX131_15385 [candidate division WS1 bacterium]|jgi:hypothetical protein|nr:hypothetical protein [candidate division WS1 bacterium]